MTKQVLQIKEKWNYKDLFDPVGERALIVFKINEDLNTLVKDHHSIMYDSNKALKEYA
jgi:hypothetical protein